MQSIPLPLDPLFSVMVLRVILKEHHKFPSQCDLGQDSDDKLTLNLAHVQRTVGCRNHCPIDSSCSTSIFKFLEQTIQWKALVEHHVDVVIRAVTFEAVVNTKAMTTFTMELMLWVMGLMVIHLKDFFYAGPNHGFRVNLLLEQFLQL